MLPSKALYKYEVNNILTLSKDDLFPKKIIERIERKTKSLKWFSENLKIKLSYVRNNQACHTVDYVIYCFLHVKFIWIHSIWKIQYKYTLYKTCLGRIMIRKNAK